MGLATRIRLMLKHPCELWTHTHTQPKRREFLPVSLSLQLSNPSRLCTFRAQSRLQLWPNSFNHGHLCTPLSSFVRRNYSSSPRAGRGRRHRNSRKIESIGLEGHTQCTLCRSGDARIRSYDRHAQRLCRRRTPFGLFCGGEEEGWHGDGSAGSEPECDGQIIA